MPLLRWGRMLKRWRYVAVFSPELSLCAAAVQVGPVRQAFWAIWDRERGQLHEHTVLRRGGVELPRGRARVADGRVELDVALAEAEAVEVVAPDGRGYVWTRKQAGVRAEGMLRLDGVERPLRGRAVIDDTAGYHRRHTSWRWAAGVGSARDGTPLAWNLVTGVNDGPRASERTVWVDGAPREVAPVRFADDLSAVRFAEGGELRFEAEATRERRDNLLVVRSRYRQPFGRFSGALPGGLELAEGLGVMEDHDAVW